MVDKTEEAVGFINNCWLAIISDTLLKEESGLKYISYMDDNNPYWHLWFADCAGVYKCELLGAQAVEGYDWLAEFTVKYYPIDTEIAYKGLSILEKACRAGNMFNTHRLMVLRAVHVITCLTNMHPKDFRNFLMTSVPLHISSVTQFQQIYSMLVICLLHSKKTWGYCFGLRARQAGE